MIAYDLDSQLAMSGMEQAYRYQSAPVPPPRSVGVNPDWDPPQSQARLSHVPATRTDKNWREVDVSDSVF